MTLRDFFNQRLKRHPDKPFLYFENRILSYEAFDAKVNQAANGLVYLGVSPGDKVSLMLPNVPEFLFLWFGLAKIGAVMVPVNPRFKVQEAGHVVAHSDSVGLVVDRERLSVGRKIKADTDALGWIGCIEDPAETGSDTVVALEPLFRSMPLREPSSTVRDDDLIQIIYTSGTTGFPKGVMHTHRDMTLTGEAFQLCAGLTSEDRVMVVLPLFHANAQYYSTMGALAAGAGLVLVRKFSAGLFWEQAVRHRATQFNFVGAVGRILCGRPESEFRPDHRIRTAYGALVTPDVYEHFTRRFKIVNVIDGYGLTEVPRVSQNPIGGRIKMRSMGLPAPHPDPGVTFAQVKVVDNRGETLSAGDKGELIIRSPVMMKGYYKDARRTREAVRDGWFYSGDYVYRDADGYLFFVDRKKDIIRKRGENISAAEIEAVINSSPKVLENAVIAVPSELGEDEVMACIVLKKDAVMTPEEIVSLCKSRLADFKVPGRIAFLDALPKTATERVAKHILRKAFST
jgi:carnitine-CoA ligase